jgi:hypothetical protein
MLGRVSRCPISGLMRDPMVHGGVFGKVGFADRRPEIGSAVDHQVVFDIQVDPFQNLRPEDAKIIIAVEVDEFRLRGRSGPQGIDRPFNLLSRSAEEVFRRSHLISALFDQFTPRYLSYSHRRDRRSSYVS